MKLKFEPFDKEMGLLFDPPAPSAQAIPNWYKDMAVHMDNEKLTGLNKDSVAVSNLTLKGCNPFLDALTSGYTFKLPFDVEFRKDNQGRIGIRWATNVNFISGHGPDQAPGLPGPVGGSETLLKWRPGWRVSTPKGYSTLFTHPLNRHDLPFRTFSGVVDTDMYELGVELPFQLLNNLEKDITILEKGTPICQIIPFKREDWNSEIMEFDEDQNKINGFKLKSKIVRSYKSQFWQKKTYR
jgi:hypothetical protein